MKLKEHSTPTAVNSVTSMISRSTDVQGLTLVRVDIGGEQQWKGGECSGREPNRFELNLSSSSVHLIIQHNSWMCPGVAQVERQRDRV
jgi:hypothetical protein